MFTNISVIESSDHNIQKVLMKDNPVTFCKRHHSNMEMTFTDCVKLFNAFQGSTVINVEFSEFVQVNLICSCEPRT